MVLLKQAYVGVVHKVAACGSAARLTARAQTSDPYGWHRWLASLLAIHNTRAMVALDLPWWNVAATRDVARFLEATPGARVFEYGAGASTAWLARRSKEVVSVEHHAEFARIFRDFLKGLPNATLLERTLADDPSAYVGAIAEIGGQFDLIVIDGRQRIACLEAAVPYLKPHGIVLFDDSGRHRYRKGIENCALSERRYFGRSFCVPYPDYTSILAGGV